MANIFESPSWEDDISLIGRTERVSGGLDGVANRPIKQLANRTRYLKEKSEAIDLDLSGKIEAVKTFTDGATLLSPREEIIWGAYRMVWTGDFPKTVPAGSTPQSSGGIGAGRWAYTSDAALRESLIFADGFHNIGKGNYTYIRQYDGDATRILCYGVEHLFDGGDGEFERNDRDVTSPDNNCTIIVDALGRRWYRHFKGNIQMRWTGVKTTDETDAPQDAAFKNCLLAAAAHSRTGWPQMVIEAPPNARVYLAEMHYIRCGEFSESDVWRSKGYKGTRFGIIGTFALAPGAGFTIVQARKPLLLLDIDNSEMTFSRDFTREDYALRLEAIVFRPELDVDGTNYGGTLLYSTGKSDMSMVRAHWPDITQTLPSMQNLGKAKLAANACGRTFCLSNTGAGFGHILSVWSQDNRWRNVFSNMYDVSVLAYEDYVPHTEDTGGLLIDSCGTMNFPELLTGAGGRGRICIHDSPSVHIGSVNAICGAPTYSADTPDLFSFEICNSRVLVGTVHTQNPGAFARFGFNAFLSIQSMECWDTSELFTATNDLSKLNYRGQRAGNAVDGAYLVVGYLWAQSLNNATQGAPCRPPIRVEKSVNRGELTINGGWLNNIHAGYGNEAESKLYIAEVLTDSDQFKLNVSGIKLRDNISNYVFYVEKQYTVGAMRDNDFNFNRIRFGDGTQSSTDMRDSTHPELGSTALPLNGTDWSYNYSRAGRYHGDLVVAANSKVTVKFNDQVLYSYSTPGTYPLNLVLPRQSRVNIATEGTVTLINSSWRYTTL
ncbi:hypothetical protein [Klebsiella variicola]|uniref:tail fiber/spike domain-containing protein n=1 Tax=Klebsiella variicola TaxID=244366 RepID=UPI0013CE9E81|nr:hypothetical protein [Klebsiella variicola]